MTTPYRLIIAGGRNYQLTPADELWLDTLPVVEVISGGNASGEAWAKSRLIPVRVFHADWKTHGNAAGPIRNREMAEYANAVALFPGADAKVSAAARAARITIFDRTKL